MVSTTMNRIIVEIDAEMARLRSELLDTQKQIEGLAEKRGRALSEMENDTAFRRKTQMNSASGNSSA